MRVDNLNGRPQVFGRKAMKRIIIPTAQPLGSLQLLKRYLITQGFTISIFSLVSLPMPIGPIQSQQGSLLRVEFASEFWSSGFPSPTKFNSTTLCWMLGNHN